VLKTQNCELDRKTEYNGTKYVEIHIIMAIIYYANLSSST